MATTKKTPTQNSNSIKSLIEKNNNLYSLFDDEGDLIDSFEKIEEINEYLTEDSNDQGTFYVYKLVPVQKITVSVKCTTEKF